MLEQCLPWVSVEHRQTVDVVCQLELGDSGLPKDVLKEEFDHNNYCVVPERNHAIGNPKGEAILKANTSKGTYKAKMEFLEG